jgi:hypothetical protein
MAGMTEYGGLRIPLIVTSDSGIVTADSGDRDRAWCCAV